MVAKATIEFFWGAPQNAASVHESADRVYYTGFNLNGVSFQVGDYVLLYPEEEASLHYVARLVKCFHDKTGAYGDPHCVEVAWFERAVVLEAGAARESREVVELEETDVNPIGCISGKACVLRASSLEEATQLAQASVPAHCEWFWCGRALRAGVLLACSELADQAGAACRQQVTPVQLSGKRSQAGGSGPEDVDDSEEADAKRSRLQPEEMPTAPVRRTGKLVSGRTCVECGATQTPQWREGPAGPKTLCNACGVRYVRAQQRANKRAVSMGMSRPSGGSGGRQSRVSKGARAEPASGPRGGSRAAASAAAMEEVSQRPLRQAALLAANKTAQYARTGVFPQSATELQLQQQQQPYGGVCGGADLDLDLAGRPGMPLCSSAAASAGGSASEDSLPEGVTVEVVVDGCDVDGCCGGAGGAAVSPAMGLPMAPYGALPAVPGGYPQHQALTHMGMVPSAGCCPERPATAMGMGSAVVQGMVPLAGHVVLLGAAAPAGADSTPSTSGSGSGLAAGSGSGADCCASGLAAAAMPLQQHHHHHHHGMSVPVSPSANRPSAAACDLFVSGDEDEAGAASCMGLYGASAGPSSGLLGAGEEEAFGSLVGAEVDFGLGPASGDGGVALFDVLLQPGGPCDGVVPDGDVDGDMVVGVCDLPDVAARAAPYCMDLAPGTAARQLLDAAPLLLIGGDVPVSCGGCGASSSGAAVAGGAEAEAAVRQLVGLGAEAGRAATEALAASEAAAAVEQAAEAHADAARRARDAAACNLERLREAISGIAGPEAAAAVALDCSSLIELPHGLGSADGGAAGAGGLLGMGLGSSLFDDAALVAVHS
ncbi:hypothetical protein HXX76_014523 [Chlamydomonas incerta]|uniref:GATA-type domain-containing protein n=1 Tax=Chlamydomonas incerta TaxID=51695 RepID=A0A835SFA0_CHLIN|nr:hypothetical protein HXX76_014523 [Chlamydomonas incerta]|eukprot:KAG2424471.1 hypothetical protein HXX76_014523 [Chlamydomonas incerta]